MIEFFNYPNLKNNINIKNITNKKLVFGKLRCPIMIRFNRFVKEFFLHFRYFVYKFIPY